MKARINKIINWKGNEYAHIVEDEPTSFCDICVFSEECADVLRKKLNFEESPMKICEELCKEAGDVHFAMFVNARVAESYVEAMNDEAKRIKKR